MSRRCGLLRLPPGSERVEDADEEVFLLYTNLQATPFNPADGFRGLGHLDSRKDKLSIQFDLVSQPIAEEATPSTGRSTKKKKKPAGRLAQTTKSVEIQLAQDPTALRSRKGDTRSVVWRTSIDFAHFVLQQHYTLPPDSLIDFSSLENSHVLELGAGTGMLAVALSPLARHYTVTDIDDLLPLIRKNLQLNFNNWPNSGAGANISLEELDWLDLIAAPASSHPRLLLSATKEPVDLILVLDCIYHPSLLPALVETIDFFAVSGRTAVLVVVELRAEDVVRQFLNLWLQKKGWEVWRVLGLLDGHYAMWAGWKGELRHAD